jgi:anti-sigma28 factor (negative regulator of flagellin synthesis)
VRISEEQVRVAIKSRLQARETQALYDKEYKTSSEAELISRIRDEVMAMPDVRHEMVLRIKEAVERGEYNVTAEEIVEAMVRREAADRLR